MYFLFFFYWKWGYSIAMLDYRRVCFCHNFTSPLFFFSQGTGAHASSRALARRAQGGGVSDEGGGRQWGMKWEWLKCNIFTFLQYIYIQLVEYLCFSCVWVVYYVECIRVYYILLHVHQLFLLMCFELVCSRYTTIVTIPFWCHSEKPSPNWQSPSAISKLLRCGNLKRIGVCHSSKCPGIGGHQSYTKNNNNSIYRPLNFGNHHFQIVGLFHVRSLRSLCRSLQISR